jgi:hypothetical protein
MLTINTSNAPVSGALGFQVLGMNAGDPVGISNCTQVPGFNLQTKTWINGYLWPTEVQAEATTGSAPWNGTFSPSNVTVTYNWGSAAPGAVDNGGYCTLTNAEGGPQNLSINHMTFITDATESVGDGPSSSNGPEFSRNNTFVNSILLSGLGRQNCGGGTLCGGWWDDALPMGEGNSTETYNYDASTMTAAWLVWPGRPNTKGVRIQTILNIPITRAFPILSARPRPATGTRLPGDLHPRWGAAIRRTAFSSPLLRIARG